MMGERRLHHRCDRRAEAARLCAASEPGAGGGSTYVLGDLDVGEGVLGGLRWQRPDAEGGGDGGQAGGGHHFSLREEEKRRKEQE